MKKLISIALVLVMMLPAIALADSAESGTLQFGMEGAEILALQTRLEELGYYKNGLDGKFGNGVLTAVKQFQRNNGLTVDGKVGPITKAKIYSSDAVDVPTVEASKTLAFGASGEGHVRISYSYSVDHLIEALKRIEEFVQQFKQAE